MSTSSSPPRGGELPELVEVHLVHDLLLNGNRCRAPVRDVVLATAQPLWAR
jgi:hypothetical protein